MERKKTSKSISADSLTEFCRTSHNLAVCASMIAEVHRMESLMSIVSLGGSAASFLATFYFWLIRANRERPRLRPYILDREFFLGNSTIEIRQIGVKVGLIIANYSTLPNALVGSKASLRGPSGQWVELGQFAFDKQTPLPLNLPPMTTVLLRVAGNLTFPCAADLEEGNKTAGNYLRKHLGEPRALRIELRSLNDRTDTFELILDEPAKP
ncbi:MAG: hypothetical protein U0744_13915 [Gemmataceae bacterium]